jgi:hypothetical protein
MWEVNNPRSQTIIFHQDWQFFLDHHLISNEEGINMVDYIHLKAQDIQQVKDYINRLSKIPIDEYNRQEQLA